MIYLIQPSKVSQPLQRQAPTQRLEEAGAARALYFIHL